MDTSKEYIEMCSKAIETQEEWKPIEGDWFKADKVRCLSCEWFLVDYKYPEFKFAMTEDLTVMPYIPKDDLSITIGQGKFIFKRFRYPIWLPRQDQLQEMVRERFSIDSRHINIVFYFNEFLHGKYDKSTNQCAFILLQNMFDKTDEISQEKLWLAFVMKKKYNKTWIDKEWVKI